ncbi:Uncharacterized protein PBTT_08288 [Plasmodiophora brassicae]|uniref:Uncharacterized protein n=1 Tax=Plasmodiophora brassicae TaxID=37360 RepID=A0A0G4J8T2_PLABS|nr:hypothetical protein PBRA_009580 [Plasmodiophora brassicae]
MEHLVTSFVWLAVCVLLLPDADATSGDRQDDHPAPPAPFMTKNGNAKLLAAAGTAAALGTVAVVRAIGKRQASIAEPAAGSSTAAQYSTSTPGSHESWKEMVTSDIRTITLLAMTLFTVLLMICIAALAVYAIKVRQSRDAWSFVVGKMMKEKDEAGNQVEQG